MLIADQSQRNQALDASQSFIVQAPAGSGKTELLTQRYLALLAQAKRGPEEIIAITFTRKAAAEMRQRILTALHKAQTDIMPTSLHEQKTWQLAKQTLSRDQQQQWQILANPNRLRIQTIDSLCSYITKQMPVLAEFGAQPTIAADLSALYQQAALTFIQSIDDDVSWAPQLSLLIMHLDNQLNKLLDLFSYMLACRDQWLPYINLKHQPEQLHHQLTTTLIHLKQTWLDQVNQLISTDDQQECLALVNFAAENLSTTQFDTISTDFSAQCHFWQACTELLLTKTCQWRQQIYTTMGFPAPSACKDKTTKAFYQTMKQRLQALLEKFSCNDELHHALSELKHTLALSYQPAQQQTLLALLELLPILAAQLTVVFKETQQIDFIEIANAASRALGKITEPSDLALAFDYQIQHLLIDEFQDTSLAQFHLLQQLTAGWQADDGRTLFVVGDPMQSIYRFRKAEVGLFLQLQRCGINEIRLTPLTLSVNFRSTPAIIHWLNDTFSQSFPATANIDLGAIPYSPAESATLTPTDDQQQAIHYYLTQDEQHEAQHIIQLLQKLINTTAEQSIAILVKSRRHLLTIIANLRDANIPYQAVEIETLGQNPLIMDLINLTKALTHLADRVAWLAILRAPWCGLYLKDLHQLVYQQPELLIWDCMNDAAITQQLTVDGQTRLQHVRHILEQAFAERRQYSLSQWIKHTWQQLHGPSMLTNDHALIDVNNYFELLDSIATGDQLPTLSILEDTLNKHYRKTPPQNSAQSIIQLMTIHKAKGLEFDNVIIPGLHRSSQTDPHQLLLWLERPFSKQQELLLAPIAATASSADPIYQYLRREHQRKQYYETGRLLYVALTRAKQQLHLFCDQQYQTKKPSKTSMLIHIWQAINSDLSNHAKPLLASTAIPTEPINKPNLIRFAQLPNTSLITDFATAQTAGANRPPPCDDPTPRLLGTCIHYLLAQFDNDAISRWQHKTTDQHYSLIQQMLRRLGVPADKLTLNSHKVLTAITNMLNDPRGLWILSQQHHDAHSEYPLTLATDNKIVHYIIDRTFIDTDQQRWIIDYKISEPEIKQTVEDFLDQQQQCYRSQLESYAKAMYLCDNNLTIKLGLYFPLTSLWREWQYETT